MSPTWLFRDRRRPGPGPGPGRRPASTPVPVVLRLALVLALVAGACSGSSSASFNPAGTCVADGRVAGAYPDLEALVPKSIGSTVPKTLDSGRNCTPANLNTLVAHGVREVRFAGGVWADGSQSGVTLAVWVAPGLQADWMGEWYEAGARAGRVTGNLKLSKPVIGGREGHRMDLVNGESLQTVITWPAAPGPGSTFGDVVNVLIAADEPERRIQEALAAFL